VEARLSQPGESDWEENAVAVKDDEVLERIEQATLAEMHEVQLALNRIADGKYGTCMTCGRKIAPARLEALPFATLCIDCA
jgi:RNA polymerase-binding transcription factor DksA